MAGSRTCERRVLGTAEAIAYGCAILRPSLVAELVASTKIPTYSHMSTIQGNRARYPTYMHHLTRTSRPWKGLEAPWLRSRSAWSSRYLVHRMFGKSWTYPCPPFLKSSLLLNLNLHLDLNLPPFLPFDFPLPLPQ